MTLTDPPETRGRRRGQPLDRPDPGASWPGSSPPAPSQALFRKFAPNQWERKLTIAAITWLMLEVVTGARRSVHAAYQADVRSNARTLEASYQALYQKYGRLSTDYSAAVVRASGQRCLMLLAVAMATLPELFGWEGYRVRIIDGTDLDGTEHRLGVLRTTSRPACRAGASPATTRPAAWSSTSWPARTRMPPSGSWSGRSSTAPGPRTSTSAIGSTARPSCCSACATAGRPS